MENLTTKFQIGLLEGKVKWSTWRYKICILLKSITDAMEVVEGKLRRPEQLQVGAGDVVVNKYKCDLARFVKADSNALLLLTTNMSDDTLRKVMRFTSANEVWLELHRLFGGTSEDKSYNLCMTFFGQKRDQNDDIATHMCKLKNIWTELNQELYLDNNKELPELLLVCKILDTLGEEYFSFRSSWLLLPKTERNVENLTSHLCAYERALSSKHVPDQEALSANMSRQKYINNKTKKVLEKKLHL